MSDRRAGDDVPGGTVPGDEPLRVLCMYCGKRVLVLSDATVRKHRDASGRLCEGWGQFKEQVDAERILVCSHPRGLVCVWCQS